MADKKDKQISQPENTQPDLVKKKQQLTMAAIVVAVAIVFYAVYSLMDEGGSSSAHHEKVGQFAQIASHVDAESSILQKTEERLLENEKTTEALKRALESDQQTKAIQEQSLDQAKKSQEALLQRIESLEKRLSESSVNPSSSGPFFGSQGAGVGAGTGIREDEVTPASNVEASENEPPKTSDNYVPPGTFVKAVMLGGADASAATNAQSNPTPMLFRIIEEGVLPNHQKSHLKGCLATAAVVGDISSERGMIRLENLSCSNADTGEIVDKPVEGTVFGPEGKNGVRGTPIWREGALLSRAFAAGTLSGMAGGVSQRYTTTSVSPLGNTQTISGSDVFKYGAASGVSNAMEKLADYNIQRAEQYHPVIQLSAGVVVDLVFLKGFYLDNDRHDSQSSSSDHKEPHSLFSPLTLSPKQLERLKDRVGDLGVKISKQGDSL